MRILVVEDDPGIAGQLVRALKDANYAVDQANDGEEGHFLGGTEPYDEVVLDLGQPVTDGITVLERWRSVGRSMKVSLRRWCGRSGEQGTR